MQEDSACAIPRFLSQEPGGPGDNFGLLPVPFGEHFHILFFLSVFETNMAELIDPM